MSGKDFSVFVPPAITPAGEGAIILEISPLVAGKNSSELELGKKWLKWWASSPGAAQFRWEKFRFPTTVHTSPEDIAKDDPAMARGHELIQAYPKKLIRLWEATPVEIVEKAVDAFNTMLVEPDKYMELLNSIEATAKETWPNYGVEY